MTTTPAVGATITALAPTTRIALRTANPAAAGNSLGVALPPRIGDRSAHAARTALCLGPDEWLIEAPETEGAALATSLADLATRMPLSAVEVSDREITLALEGPAVLDLLSTGCPLDLARLPVGNGTRTIFDSVQVILTRAAEDRFHLTVWRSFGPHVRSLLEIAARELAAGL